MTERVTDIGARRENRATHRMPFLERRVTTATSSKVSGIGADGLCTVTSHAEMRSSAMIVSATSAPTVSMRLRGSPPDDRGDLLRECTVVDGLGEVVGVGGGTQIEPQDDVDEEVLAVGAFVVEDPVIAPGPSVRVVRSGQPCDPPAPNVVREPPARQASATVTAS